MFKIIRYAGGALFKWGPRAFATAKVAGKAASWTKGVKYLWRGLDVALTGYAIYDFFSDDENDTIAARERANDLIMDQLLSPEVKLALELKINDSAAVAAGFTNAALVITASEQLSGATIKGLSYLALGDYLKHVPVGTKYSSEDIETLMSTEIYSLLTQGLDLDQTTKDELKAGLSDVTFKDLPEMSLRHFDFIIYMFDQMTDVASNINPLGTPTLELPAWANVQP